MDTNKLRELFEAAYAALSTVRNGRFHPEVFTRGVDGEYVIPSVQSAWWAWQASREAVVVELPNPGDYEIYHADCLCVDEVDLMKAVRAAIEVQGLKVKP